MQDNKIQERVFILYAGEDKESENIVHQMTSFLKFLGISYADYKDINTMYEKRISDIYESIDNSPKIIFVLSQKYLTNVEYCQKEIHKIMLPKIYDKIKDRLHIVLTSDLENIRNYAFKDEVKSKAIKAIDNYINNELNNQREDLQNQIVAYKTTSDEFIENLKDYITNNNNFLNMFFKEMDSKACERGKSKIYDSIHELGYHFIIVADTAIHLPIHEIHKKIAEEEFDQKYLYTSSEAVHTWKKTINESDKKQSAHRQKDLDLFDVFLGGDFWKEAISNIDRIVDLGVGTGEKTANIINSLDVDNKAVNVVLVDSSSNMIKESFLTIKNACKDKFNKLDGLDGLDADFMNFAHSERCFMQSDMNVDFKNRTAFFILGGTLCNVDINRFINSLKKVIVKGDYLIMGIHIYDKQKDDKTMENLILETYDLPKLKDIFTSSLKDIDIEMSEFNYSFENNLEKGKILKFVAKLRDEKKLLTKDKYTLIESTRYKETYIENIFKSNKFEQVAISINDETAYIAFELKG